MVQIVSLLLLLQAIALRLLLNHANQIVFQEIEQDEQIKVHSLNEHMLYHTDSKNMKVNIEITEYL